MHVTASELPIFARFANSVPAHVSSATSHFTAHPHIPPACIPSIFTCCGILQYNPHTVHAISICPNHSQDLHLASLAPLCAPPAWCTSLTRLQLHRPVLCGPVFDALAALSSLSCLVLLHPVVLNYPIYPNANILGDYTSPAATSYGTWLRQRLIAEGDAWNAKPYASISHLTQLRHLEFCEEEYRVDERCGWLQLVNFPAVLRALKGLVHLRLHTAYAPANIMVAGLSTLSALTHLSARLAWEGRDMMAAGSGDRAQAGGVPQAAAGGAVAPAAQPERRHVLDCLVAGCPGAHLHTVQESMRNSFRGAAAA